MSEVSEVAYPDSNRIGKITILYETLREQREMIAALMGFFVVLEVFRHESGRGIEYIAASPLFQPLLEGEEIPKYRIECVRDGAFENPERERDRTNAGLYGFVAIRQTILRVPTLNIHTHLH